MIGLGWILFVGRRLTRSPVTRSACVPGMDPLAMILCLRVLGWQPIVAGSQLRRLSIRG